MTEMDFSKQPIEIWDVARLIPYEKNAKRHSPEQIAKLAGLIAKFGRITPLLVEEDGTIIAGHGRRLAVLKLGLAKVPVIVAYGMSKLQAAALRLADNQIVSTDYDMDMLRVEMADLGDQGI